MRFLYMTFSLYLLAGLLLQGETVFAEEGSQTGRKVALVIGVSEYKKIGRLPNAVNDARLIASTFEKLGFAVILRLDADERQVGKSIEEFAEQASGATAAVVYFAGHGIQKDSKNYLIPSDAELESPLSVEREAILLDTFIEAAKNAETAVLFIDACRNNPIVDQFEREGSSDRSANSISRGLAAVKPSGDTLIAFATLPNEVASDGQGRANSPYASALAKYLPEPNVEVSVSMKRVTKEVLAMTAGSQRPQQLSQMQREFYFNADLDLAEDSAEGKSSVHLTPLNAQIGTEMTLQAFVPSTCKPIFVNISPSRKITPIPIEFFQRSHAEAGVTKYEITKASRFGLVVQPQDERGTNAIGVFCANGELAEKSGQLRFLSSIAQKIAASHRGISINPETSSDEIYSFQSYIIE